MTFDWTMKVGDLAIVLATFAGPVLAVQAQKWIERSRVHQERRATIFRTLMATRAAVLSPAHVEALNAVPIDFYRGNRKIKAVVKAWKEYIDYLTPQGIPQEVWGPRRVELFMSLLEKMAFAVGYDFSATEKSERFTRLLHTASFSQSKIPFGKASLGCSRVKLPCRWKLKHSLVIRQRRPSKNSYVRSS